MDSDEFSDGLADEDFLTALDQVPTSRGGIKTSAAAPITTNGNSNGMGRNSAATVALELEDLPSDAFSSPEPTVPSAFASTNARQSAPTARSGLNRTESGSYRQTTLWGGEIPIDAPLQSQTLTARVYRADQPREVPTHHEIDKKAMETWVYPTNLGATRDYQFSIVKNSLFNNTLVALPTGLGKTFIAATVMLNFHRWTKSAKIVFVAPTKPLVAQQVDACYNIVGIPRSETTLLTGDIPPALRVDEWAKRRVFFMTPQTLVNDLSHGYADPKSIALLVIDEAHRAVGEYAYAKVTKLIRRFSGSIRVLALTATPGSKIETVQEVVDNLGISHCEIRTEESIDIRQYVHQRNVEQVVLDPSDEMNLISELFTEALKPLVEKLSSQNIWYGRNPMALTAFGLMQAQKEWFATRGRHVSQGVQFMMRATFGVLTSIAHSIKLLTFHGIKPFYDNLVDFRSEQEGKGEKGAKSKRQLLQAPSFQKMMDQISKWLKTDGFVGHPKLTALADCILNHFMDRGEDSATRVIVFSEYRDSAEDIVRLLNKHQPLIKATAFVGQADSKRGEGMKQAQQIQTIEKFRKGDFNVLVATSIGEEGLDIGQVDLIVCYDASASPIRMLQRMGRTGRKRAGNIVLLLMRGKEEEQFAKSKDNYEKMQKLICEGSRFNFRFDLSTRIVPRDIRPEVDMRRVEIPIENTQDQSLPEPKKRRAPPGKKKPPKKFHMPDNVETGFQSVASFLNPTAKAGRPKVRQNPELKDLAENPARESVMLGEEELKELNRSYRDLPFNHSVVEETDMPSMTSHPELQRQLRPVARVKHGRLTKRWVKQFHKIGTDPGSLVRPCRSVDTSNYREIPVKSFVNSDGEVDECERPMPARGKKRPGSADLGDSDVEEVQLPKRRKPSTTKATTTKTVATRPRTTKTPAKKASMGKPSFHIGSQAEMGGFEDDDEDDESNDDEVHDFSSPPKKRGRGRPRGKTQGRRGQGPGRGINSDEIGDDCGRDSDLMDSGGSDDGEDLLDFVVSDNHMPSSNHVPSSMHDLLSTSPTSASQGTPVASDKPFFVPTTYPGTQDSEDLPELGTLVGKKAARPRIDVNEGSEEDISSRRAPRGRRVVLDESDSDE